MASEQENRIVAEVMDNMKMAETEESAARRYVRRAITTIPFTSMMTAAALSRVPRTDWCWMMTATL